MTKRKNNRKRVVEEKQQVIVKQSKFVKPVVYGLLILLVLSSFYIRGIIPMDAVFRNNITVFASDDAVYQMRLIEHTVKYFPHVLEFDAYTQFPNGSFINWGSLFIQIIAVFSYIGAFVTGSWTNGLPSQDIINLVAAFFPAVIGSLVVIPVFFILKELKGYKAGLLGALLITFLPGQFLNRSVLGFTDHHVAEVFWTVLTIMFFVIAMKNKSKVYSVMAGLCLGAYLLTWTTGVLLVGILIVFVILQYIMEHMRGNDLKHLMNVFVIGYAVALIMVIPSIRLSNGMSNGRYSLLHFLILFGGIVIFYGLYYLSKVMNEKKFDKKLYPVYLGFILVGILVITNTLLYEFYNNTIGSIKWILSGNVGGGLTIAEAMPLTREAISSYFGINFYLAFVGMAILLYYIAKNGDTRANMLLIWSIFMLIITFAQNRFAYYYAVNIAILVGLFAGVVVDYVWKKVNNINDIKVQHIGVIALMVWLLIFIPFSSGNSLFKQSTEGTKYGAISEGYYEWYSALTWMRNNTPEPSLNYDGIYEIPKMGESYNYSENDYGVLSWWDYGHVITYRAHRIPNANPFQSGIGGGYYHTPGVSTFLISQNEDEANNIIDVLKSKYVISDSYMAYSIQPVFAEWNNSNSGYYQQVRTSSGNIIVPTQKYFDTMESKLHIFDGNGLKNYRLVHESNSNVNTRGGSVEKGYKDIYNKLYNGRIDVTDSGYVKIFEYVKGAKIVGKSNNEVSISLKVKTNIGREFIYSQKVTPNSDGRFEIIVPYSTTGNYIGTNFDTKSVGNYVLTFDGFLIDVVVSENDVLNGNEILVV